MLDEAVGLPPQPQQQPQQANNPPSPLQPTDLQQMTNQDIANGTYPQNAGGPADLGAAVDAANQSQQSFPATIPPASPDSRSAADFLTTSPDMQATAQPVQHSMLPPEAQAFLDEYTKQQKAQGAMANYATNAATAQSAAEKVKADALLQSQKQTTELANRMNAATDTYMNQYQKTQQDIMNSKFEPKDMFAEKSTGQKIALAFAIMLGGYSHEANHQNQVVDLVQKAIDRDLSTQKFAYEKQMENKRIGAEMQKNLYGIYMDRFKDSNMALLAARDTQLAIIDTQMKAKLASISGQQAQSQGQLAISAIEQQRQQTQMGFKQAAQQQALLQSIGNSNTPLTLQQEAALPENVRKIMNERDAISVPGVGIALDPEAAKKAREIKSGSEELMADLRELLSLRKKYGTMWGRSEAAAEAEPLYKKIQMGINHANGLGALDKGSQEFLELMVKSPGSVDFVEKNYQAVLKNTARSMHQRIKPLMQTYKSPDELRQTLNGQLAK